MAGDDGPISLDPAGTAVIAENTFRSLSDPLCKPLGLQSFVETLQASLILPGHGRRARTGTDARAVTMTLVVCCFRSL
jgi:hypothetical protein